MIYPLEEMNRIELATDSIPLFKLATIGSHDLVIPSHLQSAASACA